MNCINHSSSKRIVSFNEICSSNFIDLYKSIEYERNIFLCDVVDGTPIYKQSKNIGGTLSLIEEFTRRIEAGDKAFILLNRSGKVILEKNALTKYYRSMATFLSEYSTNKVYSLYVQIFFDTCIKKKNLSYTDFPEKVGESTVRGKMGWEIFNDVVEQLRTVMAGRDFKEKIYKQTELFKKGFNSSKKYIDALFEKYARILVIRVDFAFRTDGSKNDKLICLDEAQSSFSRFLNNKRSKVIYKNLIGYIWRLESGERKGYHYHLFFFFDGSRSHKDAYLAKQIGEDWELVTGWRGIYYNCNAHKQKYKRLAIGMISHSDVKERETILQVLAYMHKEDQLLRERYARKARTWGRGEMPAISTGRTGRPRRIESLS